MPTTSSPTVTLPYNLREWIDVEPGKYDKSCFEVAKRLLRHEFPGAVEFRILAQMFRLGFTSSQYWSIRAWLKYLQKGGGLKKRFQYCVDPLSADTILYLRAIQGHSGGKHINPTLHDNVLLPGDFAEHIYYHVGCSHDMHSVSTTQEKGRARSTSQQHPAQNRVGGDSTTQWRRRKAASKEEGKEQCQPKGRGRQQHPPKGGGRQRHPQGIRRESSATHKEMEREPINTTQQGEKEKTARTRKVDHKVTLLVTSCHKLCCVTFDNL